MPNPLVSAVIPTYNYGRFVVEAVESVLAQTWHDREVIVVDDGSTDDTRQRLAPYLDRIRYIHQQNQGLSAARNTGIRAARGQWIALLDSDDLWHPEKLAFQMRYLERHPDVALLGTGMVLDVPEGWPPVAEAPEPVAELCSLEDLVLRTRFAPSAVLIRKDVFDTVGLFDADLRSAEDRDMWIRIAARFRVAKLPLPLCLYRLHGSSMSTHALRMEENELKMVRGVFAAHDCLRGRWLLYRRVLSRAACHAAWRYNAARDWLPALARLLRSFWLWPLPYRRDEVDRFCARPRMLAVLLLRMLHLKPFDPPPAPPSRRAAAQAAVPAVKTTATAVRT